MINGSGWVYFSPASNGNSTIAATTAGTDNVAIPGTGEVLTISNEGPVTVFVALGTSSSVTATAGGSVTASATGDYAVPAGAIVTILVAKTITYAAAVSASGTCIVRLARGSGV